MTMAGSFAVCAFPWPHLAAVLPAARRWLGESCERGATTKRVRHYERRGLACSWLTSISAMALDPIAPGLSVLRSCCGLNLRPFASRPLARRGAAGHPARRKAGTREQRRTLGPARPHAGFSRSGLPGP